jgi:hypothetical protein
MPNAPRRSGSAAAAVAVAIAAAAAIGLAGCATPRPASVGPAATPGEIHRALLGSNPGLGSMRAVAESRISFAGRQVSLPGVLSIDAFAGFRLDLLDPLDRVLAMVFVENGRIVQYRPGLKLAASLAVLPADCRGVDPADWTRAVLASTIAPAAGDRLADQGLWGGERVLERIRDGELRQSVRYREVDGRPRPSIVSWYCNDEPVLQLRLRDWVESAPWHLPTRVEIDYPKAGLAVRIDLSEIEGNPPATRQPLRPPLGPDIGWTSWNLPQ